MVTKLTSEILVVGGGTGGATAAIQAARCGVETILVSAEPWLGGMLTAAGVCAPDGNELLPWQTGMWGSFLKELRLRQREGLDWGWVSMFTYNPQIGAQIFSDWVQELPNLKWISGQVPQKVYKQGDRLVAVGFPDYLITAQIILDATELGDILALGEIPHRWGWELREEFAEPSAPLVAEEITQRYPVQAPTWVFYLRDYGDEQAPAIPKPSSYDPEPFRGAMQDYGEQKFLSYGRIPGNIYMINWPLAGNDYGQDLNRLIISASARKAFLQEAFEYSQGFAYYLQTQLGRRYGLASGLFPHNLGQGAFALYPYYRESRRLRGEVTVREQDILPLPGGKVAPLSTTASGEVSAIAIGNYENDHHYPGYNYPLKPKCCRWGGRRTGTPFTIPYQALIPENHEGLLVCEKNISVSHIANGSTRLQPLVMNLGQVAGVAGALSVQKGCSPRELPVRQLQEALLTEPSAPAAIIPLFDLPPHHPQWLYWQRYYLDHPQSYPAEGICPSKKGEPKENSYRGEEIRGILRRQGEEDYTLEVSTSLGEVQAWQLVTLNPQVQQQLLSYPDGQIISFRGRYNPSGGWLCATMIT